MLVQLFRYIRVIFNLSYKLAVQNGFEYILLDAQLPGRRGARKRDPEIVRMPQGKQVTFFSRFPCLNRAFKE